MPKAHPILPVCTRFGLWVIAGPPVKYGYVQKYPCKCECGTERDVVTTTLRNGASTNCGCKTIARIVGYKWKHGAKKDGEAEVLYNRWKSMRDRCRNPRSDCYEYYGGRGIYIVPEWDDYAVFRQWAHQNGFQPHLKIDRIDNDGPYAPWNCRWVTHSENCKNRRPKRWRNRPS